MTNVSSTTICSKMNNLFNSISASLLPTIIIVFLSLCCARVTAESITSTPENALYRRQATCSDGGKGYITIQDINADQEEEYNRIIHGISKSRSKYLFVLCEGTIFDASIEPLGVRLDGSSFSCGQNKISSSSNDCIISGGTEQVIIGHGKQTENLHIKFQGIIFQKFTTSSILAEGTKSISQAVFRQCTWRNFDSDFVFQLEHQKIEIIDSVIENGIGKSIIMNRGGDLYFDCVSVTSIDASAFLVTSQGGSSMVENSIFTSSYFNNVMSVLGYASQTMRKTTFFEMTYLGNIFRVEDAPSAMVFNAADVLDNISENLWHQEPTTNDGSLSAKVMFSRFIPSALVHTKFRSSEKLYNNVAIGDYLEEHHGSGVSSVAFTFDAFIHMKKKNFNDNDKLSSTIFESSQHGHFELHHFFLETIL